MKITYDINDLTNIISKFYEPYEIEDFNKEHGDDLKAHKKAGYYDDVMIIGEFICTNSRFQVINFFYNYEKPEQCLYKIKEI